MKTAVIHKGRTWWIIPSDADGFNEMRNGFQTRDDALTWAESNGYRIIEETALAT